MADFVYANVSLPSDKSDKIALAGGEDPLKNLVAADFNALTAALKSARSAILAMSPGATPPGTLYAQPTDVPAGTAVLMGKAADGSTAVSIAIDNSNAFLNTGAKSLSIRNAGTERFYFDGLGSLLTFNPNASVNALLRTIASQSSVEIRGNKNASDANPDVILNGTTTRTAGTLTSFRNNGTEKALIRYDGYAAVENLGRYTANSLGIQGNGPDGASAIGVKIGNANALATVGAKIASFYSDAWVTERAYIDRLGGYTAVGGGSGFFNNIFTVGSVTQKIRSGVADGAAAVGVQIANSSALVTAGAKIIAFYSDDAVTLRSYINKDGAFVGPDAFGRVTVADVAYTSLVTDNLIAYTSITAARTVTLTHPTDTGHVIVIKDESGNASGTFTITITDSGGAVNMQGGANQVINSAYGSVRLYWNGSKWMVW